MELNKDLYIDGVKKYLENGSNLFNKNNTIDGYGIVKSSGARNADASQCYSEFIPVEANTSYAFNINFSSNNFGVTFYNSSKTYLSGLSYNEIGNEKTFTTPANTAYIIMTIKIANKDTFMLNKGTSVLPYEEYYGKYLNNADIINGILSNNQMWRFKSFSLSGATSYDLTFDSIDDLGQFSIVIINTITSSNSSTKIGFCRNFSSYSYSNIFQDHTGTDVITNVSRTAGNVLRITTSTTSSIVVGVTYMRIFRQGLNYR